MNQSRSKVTGCFYGLALGDALGYAYESPPYPLRNFEINEEVLAEISPIRFSNQIQQTLFICEALTRAHTSGTTNTDELIKEIKYGNACYLDSLGIEYCINHSRLRDIHSMKERRYLESEESFAKVIPVALYFSYDQVMTIHEIATLCIDIINDACKSMYEKISIYFMTSLMVRCIRFPYESFMTLIFYAMRDTKRAYKDDDIAAEFNHDISTAVSLARNISKTDQECISQLGENQRDDRFAAICVFAIMRYYRKFKEPLLCVLKHSYHKTIYGSWAGALAGAICGVESVDASWLQHLELYDLQTRLYGHIATKCEEDISMPATFKQKLVNLKIKRWKKKWNSNVNLLFLDFDGVFLVPEKDEKEFLERIKELCEKYQLSIVISSSWRRNMSECEDILKEVGLQHRLLGRTSLEGFDRNEQILEYLGSHPFNRFVILDDMYLELFEKQSVKTEFKDGFTDVKLKEAREKLESQ